LSRWETASRGRAGHSGLTLRELSARVPRRARADRGAEGLMAAIVAEELERGRVLYDGTTYTLNRQAFPEDVIEALARALFDG
jgi:hypothetical protein